MRATDVGTSVDVISVVSPSRVPTTNPTTGIKTTSGPVSACMYEPLAMILVKNRDWLTSSFRALKRRKSIHRTNRDELNVITSLLFSVVLRVGVVSSRSAKNEMSARPASASAAIPSGSCEGKYIVDSTISTVVALLTSPFGPRIMTWYVPRAKLSGSVTE